MQDLTVFFAHPNYVRKWSDEFFAHGTMGLTVEFNAFAFRRYLTSMGTARRSSAPAEQLTVLTLCPHGILLNHWQ